MIDWELACHVDAAKEEFVGTAAFASNHVLNHGKYRFEDDFISLEKQLCFLQKGERFVLLDEAHQRFITLTVEEAFPWLKLRKRSNVTKVDENQK